MRTPQKTYVPFAACGRCNVKCHTFGYQNDKKAIYVNEPGLYDVLLGSHKEEAVLAIC